MGSGDQTFEILKFRTMAADADDRKHEFHGLNKHANGDPRMFKIPNDPRVTSCGRKLRRFSIDELPQLINVVRGEMSLVGSQALILEEDLHVVDWRRQRLNLKPGITGLWQVMGRDDIGFEEMVRLDYVYVTTWSLVNDLKLILRTIPALYRARDAKVTPLPFWATLSRYVRVMSTVVFAVGARPNFVKMAPVIEAVRSRRLFRQLVVHTGQHYDERMSSEILDDLGFPRPDRFLGIGSGSHAEQTGFTLIAFERVLLEERPDLVVVSGDVNATLACSLAASKLGIPVAHIESGLRSRDWSMPEEQTVILTDRVSDLSSPTAPTRTTTPSPRAFPLRRSTTSGTR